MEAPDIKAFLFFGAIGLACSLIAALLLRRSRHPFLWTAGACFFGATIAALAVTFVMQTVDSMTGAGYSFGRALQSGLAAAVILAFAMPFVCGGPAALVGLAFRVPVCSPAQLAALSTRESATFA
jgi:hypothetical protein